MAHSVTGVATKYSQGSSRVLTVGGIILVCLGLYFIILRPPFLPEDPRYMGTTLEQIRKDIPGLLLWLPYVFWVMGGHMISTGVLTCYVAITSFRNKTPGAAAIVTVSGLASIGLMAAVNFAIDSDFKWLLLLLTTPWILSLWFFYREAKWTQFKPA